MYMPRRLPTAKDCSDNMIAIVSWAYFFASYPLTIWANHINCAGIPQTTDQQGAQGIIVLLSPVFCPMAWFFVFCNRVMSPLLDFLGSL